MLEGIAGLYNYWVSRVLGNLLGANGLISRALLALLGTGTMVHSCIPFAIMVSMSMPTEEASSDASEHASKRVFLAFERVFFASENASENASVVVRVKGASVRVLFASGRLSYASVDASRNAYYSRLYLNAFGTCHYAFLKTQFLASFYAI